jgi:very-short-patch-repair endonuclease
MPTASEFRFWYYVQNRKMLGLKFRRQHPLDNYIVDFYCHELKLVIEIDGSIHSLKHIKEYDLVREEHLRALGFKVLRFSHEDVFTNPHLIEEKIKKMMG